MQKLQKDVEKIIPDINILLYYEYIVFEKYIVQIIALTIGYYDTTS